ncbi:MAG: glycosyltransferase [Saprospiraceae bacterium]
MKILLCSIGSRGDVQPFLMLGDYFSKQGHEVTVVSAELYTTLAADYQVNYQHFPGDYGLLINDSELKKAIGRNPFTIGKKLKTKVYPIIESSLQTFYDWSKWANVILYHPKTLIDIFGAEIQEKLIKAYVIPAFTPTKAFPNPILNFLPIPRFLAPWSYKITNAMLGTVKTPIKNFRQKNKLSQTNALLPTMTLYGISPSFLPQPEDYPSDHHFTGFWLAPNNTLPLDEAILKFFADDQEVLILTFGSMPYKSKIPINEFIETILAVTQLKIFVVKAWGLKPAFIKKNERVFAVDQAPFDLLFPLADYVLHHGGAGTTAIALQAGLPQMICPILHPFGDQYFWGKQVEAQGIGVAPIPLAKLTLRKLEQSIIQLTTGAYQEKAQSMGQKIKTEDGLAKALALVEAHVEQQVRSES